MCPSIRPARAVCSAATTVRSSRPASASNPAVWRSGPTWRFPPMRPPTGASVRPRCGGGRSTIILPAASMAGSIRFAGAPLTPRAMSGPGPSWSCVRKPREVAMSNIEAFKRPGDDDQDASERLRDLVEMQNRTITQLLRNYDALLKKFEREHGKDDEHETVVWSTGSA